jgi:hypothetical protein
MESERVGAAACGVSSIKRLWERRRRSWRQRSTMGFGRFQAGASTNHKGLRHLQARIHSSGMYAVRDTRRTNPWLGATFLALAIDEYKIKLIVKIRDAELRYGHADVASPPGRGVEHVAVRVGGVCSPDCKYRALDRMRQAVILHSQRPHLAGPTV